MRGIMRVALLGWAASLLLTASCAGPGAELPGTESSTGMALGDLKAIASWRSPRLADDLPLAGLLEAVQASAGYYGKQKPAKVYRFGRAVYSADDLRKSLEEFIAIVQKTPEEAERARALKKAFRLYRGGGKKKEVLVTGYYEPVIYGSRLPGIDNKVPIYGLPRDMITADLGAFSPELKGKRIVGRYQNGTLVPYYSRYEIDRLKVLGGRGYELAWVEDPVEVFFLQIQGSGRLVMPDGSTMSLGYAGTNGMPYRSIGKLMMDMGKIPENGMSSQAVKEYLRAHPEDLESTLDYNERYVFFQQVSRGPVGSIGVVLTPERSLATDAGAYPPGALAYLETEIPVLGKDGRPVAWKKISRFVVNQDTGGAIQGPARVDLFWGSGEEVGRIAGCMKQTGRLWFLAPRTDK